MVDNLLPDIVYEEPVNTYRMSNIKYTFSDDNCGRTESIIN